MSARPQISLEDCPSHGQERGGLTPPLLDFNLVSFKGFVSTVRKRETMNIRLSLLILHFAFLSGTLLVAQQNPSSYLSYRPQTDECSILEAELLSLLDRKEQIINSTERRHLDLRNLQSAKFKSQGIAREQIEVRIEEVNIQLRAEAIELARVEIASERARVELDRLQRTEGQLGDLGNIGNLGNLGIGFPAAPTIESINSIKYSRSSMVLNERREPGHYDTTTYEVVFSDGNRQIVESRTFVPLRR